MRNNNIHLILLDWMLKEMSGLSFLRTIKKQKNNSEIPVIFVTAREDEKDKIAGLTQVMMIILQNLFLT